MARIRSLKLGFFRNEVLCLFGPFHRLLFEGLWLLADRNGNLEDRPKRIHADLFPFDPSLNIDAMLTELADGPEPFIQRYTVAGKRYIAVLNFEKHQRPHHTEPESDIPCPDQADVICPPEPHRGLTVVSPSEHGESQVGREGNEEGKGREGKGEERLAPRRPSPHDLADAWNALTTSPIPRCKELTDKRKRAAQARLSDRSLDDWRIVIARINASPFCRGQNDRSWVATFDWLLQPDVAVKVLEGKYDARQGHAPPVSGKGTASASSALRAVQRLQDAQGVTVS